MSSLNLKNAKYRIVTWVRSLHMDHICTISCKFGNWGFLVLKACYGCQEATILWSFKDHKPKCIAASERKQWCMCVYTKKGRWTGALASSSKGTLELSNLEIKIHLYLSPGLHQGFIIVWKPKYLESKVQSLAYTFVPGGDCTKASMLRNKSAWKWQALEGDAVLKPQSLQRGCFDICPKYGPKGPYLSTSRTQEAA